MTNRIGKQRDPRRRGKQWVPVAYGVRMPSGLSGRPALLAELRAWQEVLPPSATWTGLTGAEVHGLWLPSPAPGTPRFVAIGNTRGQITRSELAATRHSTPPRVTETGGVHVEPASDCILAAARFLPVLDLVVLLDSAIQLRRCTRDELVVTAAGRRRGAPGLRREGSPRSLPSGAPRRRRSPWAAPAERSRPVA